MRIHFPGNEHADVSLHEGALRIGSGPEADLRLPGLAPLHVTLSLEDRRGLLLTVATPASGVFVNGRPIREIALPRLGDVLVFGGVRVLLKPDHDWIETPPPSVPGSAAVVVPRVALRGLNGPHSGQALAVGGICILGRDASCDIRLDDPALAPKQAQVQNTGAGLFLRELGERAQLHVNGIPTRAAVLKPGDQIAFNQNLRYLVEAPGYHLSEAVTDRQPVQHTGVMRPIAMPPAGAPPIPAPAAEPPVDASMSRAEAVLILLAAVFALGAISTIVYLQWFAAGSTP
jgi:pSer/pThr/pTyr-binding forkhead associated (FHA) protein